MVNKRLSYRTAFMFALGISLLLNLIISLMFLYGRDAVIPADVDRPRPSLTVWMLLMHACLNFVIAFTLYVLNFTLLKSKLRRNAKVAAVIIATIVVTFGISYAFSSLQLSLHEGERPPHAWRFIQGGMARDYFIAIIVVFSSQLSYLSAKQQQTALENEALLSENIRTRYEALKNQVDPHFLFNSLNSLNSLIKIDPEKAQEYVQELSSVFRYTLQNKEKITLSEEIKFAKSYAHLMQIRYGDSLQIEYNVDKKYDSYYVIPLSLQTMIENSIKHNVISKKQPLTIVISTDNSDIITVANLIQEKKEVSEKGGIGLTNLAERYRLMWNKEILVSNENGMFKVDIPLIREEL